jgi:hypothetical protein
MFDLLKQQFPIQWVPGALSLGVKRPGREADHSAPSSAEVKEYVELYLHSPNTPSWRDAQLKHRDNFTFTLRTVFMLNLSNMAVLRRSSLRGFKVMFKFTRYFDVFPTCKFGVCLWFCMEIKGTNEDMVKLQL